LKLELEAQPDHPDRKRIEQEIKFLKYLLNNGWGKMAQNPRRYKEYYITEPTDHPPVEWLYSGIDVQAERMMKAGEFPPEIMSNAEAIAYLRRVRSSPIEESQTHLVWSIPAQEWRFNNVACGASITGAARAKLMRAKYFAINPLYCDTDSLICADLTDHEINPAKLGTWKHEATISDLIICGKKVYGYHTTSGKEKIVAKGQNGVTWADLLAVVGGATIAKTMRAPTISRAQGQHYMVRDLRMTA